jgi:hypothetical protein
MYIRMVLNQKLKTIDRDTKDNEVYTSKDYRNFANPTFTNGECLLCFRQLQCQLRVGYRDFYQENDNSNINNNLNDCID